jgi:hypothetical protein
MLSFHMTLALPTGFLLSGFAIKYLTHSSSVLFVPRVLFIASSDHIKLSSDWENQTRRQKYQSVENMSDRYI